MCICAFLLLIRIVGLRHEVNIQTEKRFTCDIGNVSCQHIVNFLIS